MRKCFRVLNLYRRLTLPLCARTWTLLCTVLPGPKYTRAGSFCWNSWNPACVVPIPTLALAANSHNKENNSKVNKSIWKDFKNATKSTSSTVTENNSKQCPCNFWIRIVWNRGLILFNLSGEFPPDLPLPRGLLHTH